MKHPKMNNIGDKEFLFVVGAPRSGTTWLHHMLSEHPSIVGMDNELTVFSYLHLWEARFKREKSHSDQGHWKQGAPLLYSEEEFDQGLRIIAHDAYGRLFASHPEATHIIDKHPAYALRLPLICRLFPRCKVLHIIRDGREVAVSMISAKKRIGFGSGEIKGASRDWAQHVRAASASGVALGPGRYMEVRYEDLMARPGPLLKMIFEFAGLPLAANEIDRIARENSINNKQVSSGNAEVNTLRGIPDAIWKTKLSLEERWTMDRMVGDLLRSLGYAEPGWWAVRTGDKAKMALYPSWKKLMNVAGSAKHAWSTPVVIPVKP